MGWTLEFRDGQWIAVPPADSGEFQRVATAAEVELWQRLIKMTAVRNSWANLVTILSGVRD